MIFTLRCIIVYILLPKHLTIFLLLHYKQYLYCLKNIETYCLVSLNVCLLPIGNYSCLQVDLIFTRDRAFYFTTVFIPGIILVTSSFITFFLEWNAVPARVMIGILF